ncbi:MAG: hypothetical protein WCQ99_06845 [Pseudomonadota bacterium]
MTEHWHSLSITTGIAADTITAEAVVPSESPWFRGHFPSDPLVPGIALIAMATAAIKQHEAKKGTLLRITSVKRVRFKKPVKPHDAISLSIQQEKKEQGRSYFFKISVRGEMACTGIVSAETLPPQLTS